MYNLLHKYKSQNTFPLLFFILFVTPTNPLWSHWRGIIACSLDFHLHLRHIWLLQGPLVVLLQISQIHLKGPYFDFQFKPWQCRNQFYQQLLEGAGEFYHSFCIIHYFVLPSILHGVLSKFIRTVLQHTNFFYQQL